VLLAGGLLAVQVGGTVGAAARQPDSRPLDAVAFALVSLGPLALLARRWDPVLPLLVSVPVTVAYVVSDYPRGPVFLSVLTGLVLALRARAVERAERRREELRRVAGEERLRLARDLHDVLAHSLSVINVQAGVALHLDDPAQTRSALTVIRQTSRDALAEVRETLGALRGGEGGAAPRAPAAGLGELDRLVAGLRATGLDVDTEVTGRARAVPAAVDLTAYRIVQEALTNVTRHSGAAAAHLRLRYGDDSLDLVVDDAGPARHPHRTGHGLLGMTERAAAVGGAVEAGPRDGGGYRVSAHLPLRRTR
jgi:signal transduction histidine kinase